MFSSVLDDLYKDSQFGWDKRDAVPHVDNQQIIGPDW